MSTIFYKIHFQSSKQYNMFLENGDKCKNIVCMLNACQIGKKKSYKLKKFAESKVARECHNNTVRCRQKNFIQYSSFIKLKVVKL